jgi:hypothetical protein
MSEQNRQTEFDAFFYRCCANQELVSFICPSCRRHMIICNECDTLFPDPSKNRQFGGSMNLSDYSKPMFLCPNCGYAISFNFRREPAYHCLPV